MENVRPMIIHSTNDAYILTLPYVTAGAGGAGPTYKAVEVIRYDAVGLPSSLDGVLVTGDLQGVTSVNPPVQRRELVGFNLIRQFVGLAEGGLLPDPSKIGVILTGDLFVEANLGQRGGLGDVDELWREFGRQFRWVAGVAGNHDTFHGGTSVESMRRENEGLHVLDGEVVCLDDLQIAGLSGIIGRPGKAWRRSGQDYLRKLRELCELAPDFLVLHESPDVPAAGLPGNSKVRRVLEQCEPGPSVVFSGHVRWANALADLGNDIQVLNVESRAILLESSQ